MNTISEKAMLVKLSISQWSARKFDRRATQAAEDAFGTTNAGRFNKLLLADEALKKVSRAANDARTYHYDNTLPWTDEGKRILPAAHFDRYSAEMRKLRSLFEAAVRDLVNNYDALVTEARLRLNGLFSEADYPRDITGRFNFETEISPIPTGDDFRVSLNREELTRIQADIEKRVQEAADVAQHDLYKRLYEAVGHVVERLSQKDAIFRDSLIENLVELCNIIPALNIQNDPVLEQLRKQVEQQLSNRDPKVLRDNPDIRQATANDAKQILDAMGGIYGS